MVEGKMSPIWRSFYDTFSYSTRFLAGGFKCLLFSTILGMIMGIYIYSFSGDV